MVENGCRLFSYRKIFFANQLYFRNAFADVYFASNDFFWISLTYPTELLHLARVNSILLLLSVYFLEFEWIASRLVSYFKYKNKVRFNKMLGR